MERNTQETKSIVIPSVEADAVFPFVFFLPFSKICTKNHFLFLVLLVLLLVLFYSWEILLSPFRWYDDRRTFEKFFLSQIRIQHLPMEFDLFLAIWKRKNKVEKDYKKVIEKKWKKNLTKRKRKKHAATLAYKKKAPCLLNTSVNVKNVSVMIKLQVQFVKVAIPFPKLLTRIG